VAAPSTQLRAGRYLGALFALMAVLYALVFLTGDSATPKLGLDLQGGTTVTLKAKTTDGKPPSRDALEQARQIVNDRVNGLGVAESEVVTESPDQIVISVPGSNSDQAKQVGATALLRLRPVVLGPFPVAPTATGTAGSGTATGTATTAPSGTTSAPASQTASGTASASAGSTPPSPQGRPVPPLAAAPTTTPAGSSAAGTSAPASTPASKPASTPATTPAATAPPTDPAAAFPGATPAQVAKLAALDCNAQPGGAADNPNDEIVACDRQGTAKYVLAKTIIEGTEVKDASPAFDQQNLGGWVVQLEFKSSGGAVWAKYTSEHNVTVNQNDPGNNVAFVLDGKVVSAPTIQGTINGQTQITGQFDEGTATDLANVLKYGALPLTFVQQQADTISPTLGSDQLQAGLLAGGIGLVLVIIYSLIYYRLLGLVTLASLLISGVLTYACLVILGRQIGFTLTLAGIAGFIVAVGITADSFVVFFERLKDEVREGRSMRSGVPRAWVRARRTILSADAVSFLAAAILYLLAAGAVKGFAFTLGLSTVLDLVIVFLFTHPLVAIASRSRTFSSARLSGLGAVQAAPATAAAGPSAADRAAARRSRLKES
jgi:preprotein translocase subunit SecD